MGFIHDTTNYVQATFIFSIAVQIIRSFFKDGNVFQTDRFSFKVKYLVARETQLLSGVTALYRGTLRPVNKPPQREHRQQHNIHIASFLF